ncbi:kinase domain protein (macronuclear) [Tetrahymena thermophila SB210]|uniref:Kinase domain protein n=1 Tax=Tetrahymena thermophila (strain SB210) TaxID=312017 RepID=Q243B8_TETTS|nr:kinase domain protein [Tetrahymena thermophila SB210]EAS02872.2 kinase domain protein [Tetrahymena thermophila SB210]|eukprot:XP_001023117.2 kinase domain protein [Tetrahymena thermophila SB210]
MDKISQNPVGYQEAKYKLALHLQNRKKIKEMYRMKGIQMLDKAELVISDIQETKLKKPFFAYIYQTMKNELTDKGYSDFRFLGHGDYGLVLLAKDSKTNMRYAIKGVQVRDLDGNLEEDLNNQVKKEVEILKKCRESPYVVSLIDQFEGQQFSYLVLTECQGTLSQILERNQNKRLNEISAIKYANDIAQGLYYIHQKNYLVNDLKMDNILIDYHGNAVVSDFGLADNLTSKSGYTINQYMGNFLYQAPECYDPAEPYIGKIYHDEYLKLGVCVKQEPSNRSEACSLGYLIYTFVQGINYNLVSNKHKELIYDDEFQNFVYHKQLKYIIEGLTNFVPKNRMPIKEALIILKGIISFEFQLDEMLIEMIDGNTQQFTNSLTNQIEFVRDFPNKFYPIMYIYLFILIYLFCQIFQSKNEQTLNQKLNEDHQKIQYVNQLTYFIQNILKYSKQFVKKEAEIEELQKKNLQLKQKINEQEKKIKDLFIQLQQSQNQLINKPQNMMMPMKDEQHVIFEEVKKQENKDELPKEENQMQIQKINSQKKLTKLL